MTETHCGGLEYKVFDTHTHYDDAAFDEDRDDILSYIQSAGVQTVLNIGADIGSSRSTVELTEKYDFIYGAVGVHPYSASEITDGDAVPAELEKMLSKPKIVAIGEIGLDYYREGFDREQQREAFLSQIRLAKKTGKPIIVHNRDAYRDVMEIIKSSGAGEVGGVIHCYSGSAEGLREVLDNNFCIGMGGVVTFKNSVHAKEAVRCVPEDRLIIETDCPYLAPTPFRGKRNYSGYLKYVVEVIAEIRGKTPEYIAAVTAENGRRIFGIM